MFCRVVEYDVGMQNRRTIWPLRRLQSHILRLPPRRMPSDLRDLSSSEEEDEEEAGVDCPLTDEWEHVVPFLEPAAAMRLARTSASMLVMIGITLDQDRRDYPHSFSYSRRQDVVEAMARALYRGHAAGMERRVAVALTRQLSLAVDVRVRRVAARSIDRVLHVCGGRAHSTTRSARTAMGASMGDAHAVAALIAAEPDDMVRQRLARTSPLAAEVCSRPAIRTRVSRAGQKYPPLLLL